MWTRRFSTNRKGIVESQRLALINIFLVVVILIAAMLDLVLNHKYASYEAPSSVVNIWTEFGRETVQGPRENNSFFYCLNASYDVNASMQTAGWQTHNTSCKHVIRPEFIRFSSDEALIATVVSEYNETFEKSNSYFIAEPEEVKLSFQHSIGTSFGRFPNAKTNLRMGQSGEIVKTFPEGDMTHTVTVRELLRLAGADLDALSPQQAIRQRVTGIVLTVKLQFSNMRKMDLSSEMLCDAYVEHQPGLWGYMGQDEYYGPYGKTVRTRFAVRVKFVAVGQLGSFSFANFLLAFVSGVVLLKTSQAVVDFGAEYCQKGKSRQLFKDAKYFKPIAQQLHEQTAVEM